MRGLHMEPDVKGSGAFLVCWAPTDFARELLLLPGLSAWQLVRILSKKKTLLSRCRDKDNTSPHLWENPWMAPAAITTACSTLWVLVLAHGGGSLGGWISALLVLSLPLACPVLTQIHYSVTNP